jgi:hypothetical protein
MYCWRSKAIAGVENKPNASTGRNPLDALALVRRTEFHDHLRPACTCPTGPKLVGVFHQVRLPTSTAFIVCVALLSYTTTSLTRALASLLLSLLSSSLLLLHLSTMAMVSWSSSKAAGQSPFPRTLNTATAVGAKIYFVGGKDAAGNPLPMELYNLNTGML